MSKALLIVVHNFAGNHWPFYVRIDQEPIKVAQKLCLGPVVSVPERRFRLMKRWICFAKQL